MGFASAQPMLRLESCDLAEATAAQPRRNPLLPPENPNQLLHALQIARLDLVLPVFFELSWRLRIDAGQKCLVGLRFIGAAWKHLMRRGFDVGFSRRCRKTGSFSRGSAG